MSPGRDGIGMTARGEAYPSRILTPFIGALCELYMGSIRRASLPAPQVTGREYTCRPKVFTRHLLVEARGPGEASTHPDCMGQAVAEGVYDVQEPCWRAAHSDSGF